MVTLHTRIILEAVNRLKENEVRKLYANNTCLYIIAYIIHIYNIFALILFYLGNLQRA